MKTVEQVLAKKGNQVWSIHPDATVLEALVSMAERNIGALLVIDDSGPIGVISERDYARSVALKGKTTRSTRVREIMTKQVMCATPEESVEEAMAVMTERRRRHMPVVVSGHVVGLVSIGDLVKSVIAEQKFAIEQLERYVYSEPIVG